MSVNNSTPLTLTEKQTADFWATINRGGPDDCWLHRKPGKNGYGAFCFKLGRGIHVQVGAHILARSLTTGEWPGPFDETCHSCDNRACCNPAHLWLGTHKENMEDRDRKGRHHNGERPRGTQVWRAAFTEEQVVAIRQAYAAGLFTLQRLADQHQVSKHCIHCIVARKTWKHVA